MTTLLVRWRAAAPLLALTVVLAACAVYGGGYGYAGGPGLDYYEPYGGDYGGWGGSYRVAPYRGGGHQAAGRGTMPSLPSGAGHAGGAARGGGGGGGHGGGGGSRR